MAVTTNGNCYICGKTCGKIAIKNHLVKIHGGSGGGQQCCLLKIEDAYDKDYWLYVDVPLSGSLSGLDSFLRKIWLECCGHMSAFFGPGHSEIGKGRKWNTFTLGEKLRYEYDFGSTTELLITVAGETQRKAQRESVRLLARNVPPLTQCSVCGKPAAVICAECIYDADNPFFCDSCAEKHEHADMLLPVVNSPRMGVCAYDGELDIFAFKPASTV